MRSALEALPDLSEYRTTLKFDDDEPLTITAYNVVIANARFVAGGIPIAPTADLEDGLVDVLIVPSASMPQLALLAPQILAGKHLDSDMITFRRARWRSSRAPACGSTWMASLSATSRRASRRCRAPCA